MNHIRMFFTVEIEKTGRLAAIGNFLLTPPRALFNGKVVRIKDKNNIAKVSAYTYSPRVSKQDDSLHSTHTTSDPYVETDLYNGHEDYEAKVNFYKFALFAMLLIPFTVMGSIFKALSYFSASTREAHRTVKEKLTPRDVTINTSEMMEENMQVKLQQHLMTGQKTKSLVISGKATSGLSDSEIEEIQKINPSKLILENTTVTDNGLNLFSLKWNKKVHNDMNSIDEAKRHNSKKIFAPKHEIYVVRKAQ